MRYYIEKNLDFEKGVNRKDDSSNVSVLPLNEKESISAGGIFLSNFLSPLNC